MSGVPRLGGRLLLLALKTQGRLATNGHRPGGGELQLYMSWVVVCVRFPPVSLRWLTKPSPAWRFARSVLTPPTGLGTAAGSLLAKASASADKFEYGMT